MVQMGDLSPLMSEWRGEPFCQHPKFPPRSPPIFLGKTKSGSAFRFHLHVDDVGHTLMLGPTGAGKSALLSFLVAQWGRYPGSRVICFDKGYSMLGLTLACADAVHYSLGSDLGPTLAPLAALDTRAQVEWAQSWVRTLFSKLGVPLTNDQRLLLDRAVDMLAQNSKGAAKRSLTALLGQLQDVSLRDALQFYTAGSGARVLNGKSDDLRYARMTVFDLEELITMEPAVVSPTLLFLFESIQRRLTGAPTLLVIDEAWLALDNVQFAEKLREWLKVLRKANCAVVLATQSITDIVDSPIGKAVLENCPTRVLLPNHDATNPALRALYADHLQLTDEQIGIIATGIRKRHYYYSARHADGARGRLFELDLDDVAVSLVGAGSKQELARMRELSGAHGRAWVAHWLAERGCHRWAERYVELEEARQGRMRTSAA